MFTLCVTTINSNLKISQNYEAVKDNKVNNKQE
jgi:hypothetical protein